MKCKWLKFFLYARKSQESDERQIQSIEDQIDVMKKRAKSLWYDIVWVFTESKTAKAPWRVQFNEMIKRIWNWEANGIISWKLDRLTRNPIDTWTVQYMLQNWLLNIIHTNDGDYDINNSWLMFSVISWMANQFLIDLSKNVKRGLNSKADKWWFPWVAPEWYLNKLEDNTIVKNPTNFKLLKKIWNLMLTWNYSVLQVVDIANNEWWYKTTKRKKMWWKSMTYGSWYRLFNNIFYAWYFQFNWKTYEWKHEAMITLEEYYKVQKLIWDKWKAKVIKHEFPYWWIFDCWCCNHRITAENKLKSYKNWTNKMYTYYRCTKKNKEIKCDNLAIQEEELENQLYKILESVSINKEFLNWAIKIIERESKNEEDLLLEQKNNLNEQIVKIWLKLNNLNDLFIEWWIDIETFNKKKEILNNEKMVFLESLKNLKWKMWYNTEEIKKIINFWFKVSESFKNWDVKLKKLIIKSIGSDYSLYLKKVSIQLLPWYIDIQNFNNDWNNNINKFGLIKNSINTGSIDATHSNICIWQGR